jgi:hypothetical protein
MSSQPKYPERGTIPWDLALKAYIDSGDESEGGVGSVGPQGPEGPEGDPGAMGPMGDTGPIGPQGLKGDTGEQGPQGLKGDTGAQGPQGIQGVVGPTGLQGSAGTGITMKGSVATSAGLPATGNRGDAYIVQADDSLWVHDGTNFVSGGSIQGPPGSQGIQGVQGPTGATGPGGSTGPAGATGATGPAGEAGSAAVGAMTWKGDWANGSTYAKDDVVLYKGTAWHAPVAMPAGIVPGAVASAPIVNLTNVQMSPTLMPHTWLGSVAKPWVVSPASALTDYKWFYFDVTTVGTLDVVVTGGGNSTVVFGPDGSNKSGYFTNNYTGLNADAIGRWKIGTGYGGVSTSGTIRVVPGTAVLAPEPVPPERWEALASGMTWKGTYNAASTYALNDAVLYNGDLYIAPVALVAGITPGGTEWTLVSKGSVAVQDEGSALTQRDKINFVGAGVTVTDDSANARTLITVPGGATVQDEGSVLPLRDKINFVGTGVTATDDSANAKTLITIPGGAAVYEQTAQPPTPKIGSIWIAEAP